MDCLAVIETHPIQYRAPVYRVLQQQFNIPVIVIYGSDLSVVSYNDREFGANFAWDTDLLSGYSSLFLSRVAEGGPPSINKITARDLNKTLKTIKPRAVMIVGYNPSFHRAAFYEAWKGGYPIIFRGETTDHAEKRSPLKSWLRDSVLRWAYKKCAKLLYIGKHSYNHFKCIGIPEEKLIFSPYCVDTTLFKCDTKSHNNLRSFTRKNLGIAENDIAILFSGKLSIRKGPDLLLTAIKKLINSSKEQIVVIFLGDGKLRRKLERFAREAPALRTHFVGFKNQSQLSRYYHAADLLVLPSRYNETWGLVVNEALHHGLPCVVSEAVGCAPDLVKTGITGEIFETGSVPSLAEAIKRSVSLIHNENTAEDCKRIVSNYTVEKAAKGIAEAYRAVVNKNER